MAKRGVFFRLYLNPAHSEDQEIIAWLKSIARSRRSQKVREVLLGTIRGQRPSHTRLPDLPDRQAGGQAGAFERAGSHQEASGMAKNFLSSLSKKRPS